MNTNIYITNIVITNSMILQAEQVLIDNGIYEDEAETVLEALGYVLLDYELYADTNIVIKDVTITDSILRKAEQVLIDNGIDDDEAETVLQAISYVLLNWELYE